MSRPRGCQAMGARPGQGSPLWLQGQERRTVCFPRADAPEEPSTGAMYRAFTHNIEVKVTPRFLNDRSSPADNYYFWAYSIEIVNHGAETVQLVTRHWRITDALGRCQEVRG